MSQNRRENLVLSPEAHELAYLVHMDNEALEPETTATGDLVSGAVEIEVLGPLLSVAQAIRVLGIRATDARRWLRQHGLISEALGGGCRRRVVLADLLQAVRQHDVPEPATRRRPRGRQRLPRVRL